MERNKLSARAKLLNYFKDNVGKRLTSDELRAVAGISEWARRIRELRAECYEIQTFKDRSDLKPNEYLMTSTERRDGYSFAGNISKETRAIVLNRNGYTCQHCGVSAGEIHPFDGRKVSLHIGHIMDRSEGGSDEPNNLRALCSVCNEGEANISPSKPSTLKVLAVLRKADLTTQKEALRWLQRKFPESPPLEG